MCCLWNPYVAFVQLRRVVLIIIIDRRVTHLIPSRPRHNNIAVYNTRSTIHFPQQCATVSSVLIRTRALNQVWSLIFAVNPVPWSFQPWKYIIITRYITACYCCVQRVLCTRTRELTINLFFTSPFHLSSEVVSNIIMPRRHRNKRVIRSGKQDPATNDPVHNNNNNNTSTKYPVTNMTARRRLISLL